MKGLGSAFRVVLLLVVAVPLLWQVWQAWPITPEKAASRTFLSLAKFRWFSGLAFDHEKKIAAVYAEGMEFIPTNSQFAVVSAEKLWLRPSLRADIRDWHLLPEPYLRKHGATLKNASRVFTEHGAAFEVLTVHTNLLADVSDFWWSTLPADTSGRNLRFPIMWSKHPEMLGGVRFCLDISGGSQAVISEQDFKNYFRGALAWVRRDASDDWILSLLSSDSRADVENGKTLLLRQVSTNAAMHLKLACEWHETGAALSALRGLEQVRTIETVQALARACEGQPKRWIVRERAVSMLRKLADESDANVRAAAEAALEKL